MRKIELTTTRPALFLLLIFGTPKNLFVDV